MELTETLKNTLASKKDMYLTVRIVPKSPYTKIVDVMTDGSYKIRVAAPPTDGKANAALVRFLKKELCASDVVIVSGKMDRVKLIHLKTA